MRRTGSRRAGVCRGLVACAALCALSLLGGARAGEAAAEPPRPFPELGRLVGTAGVTSLEGAGGGGLVPWALITGYGSRDGFGANLHATGVRLADFSLGAAGVGLGIADRLELSYQHQWLDTRGAGARLGLGRGYTFEQDIFGAKLRLFGDVVADQDRWWPQVSVGVQHKRSADRAVVRAVGARDAAGTDFYVAATRLVLDAGLLLNGTLRLTRANQFGLLGHGGDGRDGYSLQPELSAALMVSHRVVVGGEFRGRPDNLRFASEGAGFSAFAAWFAGHHLSVTLAYVDLGGIANQGRQNGIYLSIQAGF